MALDNSLRPDILFSYFRSLSSFAGVGPKRSKTLMDKIGPHLIDLLFHFPAAIEERRWASKIKDCQPTIFSTLFLEIVSIESKRNTTVIYATDGEETLSIVYFNTSIYALKRLYPEGQKRLISGKMDRFQHQKQMIHPDFVGLWKDKDKWIGISPVYSRVGLVGKFRYRQLVQEILHRVPDLPEWIPNDFLTEMKWPSFKEALKKVHAPTCLEDLSPTCLAYQRLAFDELLNYQIQLQSYSQQDKVVRGIRHQSEGIFFEKIKSFLPFQLTKGQEKIVCELREKMSDRSQMRALLMGDVGSGKTIVSFLAALDALEFGYQVAFLAPTALLAQQHFETLKPFCDSLKLPSGLLVGSLKEKEKKDLKQQIQSGDISFLVGTHALLEETVVFKKLSFVVIDEQHRFGVEQRKKLVDVEDHPDILYLSATPIPRTLAMTLYGNLDVFILKEKPAYRQPIQTLVMSLDKEKDLYAWLRKLLAHQEKVFWVCPLIEESDLSDSTSVADRYDQLNQVFPGVVEKVHGQQKSDEKEDVMQKFKEEKKGGILVSTTVIEVGIDVPEATVMVIENAERFGLSQLHQLRGRVGRGHKKSFCVLLYKAPLSEIARQRLQVLRTHDDGFLIAEEDLKLRGSGNLFGTEQSGVPKFVCAQVQAHYDLIFKAKEIVQKKKLDFSGAASLLPHLFLSKETSHV